MRLAYSVLTFVLGALLVQACASNPIASGSGGAGGNGSGGSGSGGSGSGGSGSGGSAVAGSGGAGSGGVSATKTSTGGEAGATDAAVGSSGVGSGGSTAKPNTGGSGGAMGTGGGGSSGTGGSGGAMGTGGGGSTGTGGSGGATARADAATDVAGGTGGTSYDAGTGGAAGCDKDLTGTWDLYTTSLASGPSAATLVLGASGFTYTMTRGQLAYTATGTKSATYKTSSGTRPITVQNTPVTVNGGSFPLALGGHWTLASNHETCTLDVAAGTVKGNCNGRPGEFNVAADDWPYIIPSPENGRIYTFTRAGTAASQFGDFGGQWTAKSDTGSGQGCAFQLQGNAFTSTCAASNDFNGVMHLTIGSDCVASGTTPSGLEVSGRRR